MHFLFDEAGLPTFAPEATGGWKIAVVAGVMLPYEGQKLWLEKYKRLQKGREISDLSLITQILKDLISWRAQGVLEVADHGHASLTDVATFRKALLEPHHVYAEKQQPHLRASLVSHLERLEGLSPQDFIKTITILEGVTNLTQCFLQSLNRLREIDRRKVSLIIDDQVAQACPSLQHFLYYFLNCRAVDGHFVPCSGFQSLLRWHVRQVEGGTYFSPTTLFKKIIVAANAKLDDRYPGLKAADCLANFSRRVLRGDLPIEVARLLVQIFKKKNLRQFHPTAQTIDVSIPPHAIECAKLLMVS